MRVDRDLNIGSGLLIRVGKLENDNYNEPALLKVVLLDIVALFVIVEDKFGLLGQARGVFSSFRVTKL